LNDVDDSNTDANLSMINNLTFNFLMKLSRDVTIHNTEDCESRVLMIERSQR
jgi:hypothetical protein